MENRDEPGGLTQGSDMVARRDTKGYRGSSTAVERSLSPEQTAI